MNHRTDDLLFGGNSNEFEDFGYEVGGRKKQKINPVPFNEAEEDYMFDHKNEFKFHLNDKKSHSDGKQDGCC